jgi:hypothetical protein
MSREQELRIVLRVTCPLKMIIDVKFEARIGQAYEEWNVSLLERKQRPDMIASQEVRTH